MAEIGSAAAGELVDPIELEILSLREAVAQERRLIAETRLEVAQAIAALIRPRQAGVPRRQGPRPPRSALDAQRALRLLPPAEH